jgi:ADP-ribose pyrophosphatase
MLDPQTVCLIRNFRPAVEQTLVELPAGTLEPNESPDRTARRELAEETGYVADRVEKLHEFFMSPGILNERMVLYLATGLTPGPTCLDESEEIERLIVGWDEAMQMVHQGHIQDAKTLVGLLYYDRLR